MTIDAPAKAPTINALGINATAINAPATNNALAATVPSAEALAIDAPAADELDAPAADELAITIPIADALAHEVLAYKPTSTKRSFHCDSSSEEEGSKTEAIAESLAVLSDPVLATIIPQDLGSHYREQHRKAFFSQAFGSERKKTGGEEKKKGNNSMCKPKEEFDAVLHAFHTFHVMNARDKEGDLSEVEKKEFNKFKKDNKQAYKWKDLYHTSSIELPDGSTKIVMRQMEKKAGESLLSPGQIVVSQEDVFDIIDELHRANGHMGQEWTHAMIAPKYYSITQDMVRIYCRTCHVCMEKNPTIQTHVGAKKPIYSSAWHDRFQVDLIDMRKFPRPDIYGVIQRWIMTVKDHSTSFTAVFSLPQKKPAFVAFELEKYFGLVGYPAIFHTDNGNEFTARLIIDMIADINPSIITVTGRPRTPRDQGECVFVHKVYEVY